MIIDARQLLSVVKDVTREDFDQEAVDVLDGIVRDWTREIEQSGAGKTLQVKAGIFHGILLGIRFAARGRAMMAKQAADDRGFDVLTGLPKKKVSADN